MIDHSRKLLFVHIARTGGTSIETALVGKDWWKIEPKTKHITATDARALYGETVWNTYTTFSVIRNPWDRVISMWATKWWHQGSGLDEDCSFEEFIRKMRPHPNEKYNTLLYHKILDQPINFILRFETLQDDFDRMLKTVGTDNVPLPWIAKGKHKHYTAMYGETEKQLVAEKFSVDISQFGYSF